MIGKTLAHYEILSKIGAGGMGEVYRARDTKLGRDVALKLLRSDIAGDEESRRRFLRESRAVASVTHPYVATLYDADESDGSLYLAIELVEGEALDSLLRRRPLPIRDALRLGVEIAEGLASAHKAGVIHRDLKPGNVMVGPDGHAKILDFGLAKLVERRDAAAASELSRAETTTAPLTTENRIIGTPAYMSPEQARGDAIDSRSDVFSFGSTLYEMVTGKTPFPGPTNLEMLAAILHEQPSPATRHNPHVPPELEQLLRKCLEKDPRDRYQHAEDLAVDLRRIRPEFGSRFPATQAVHQPMLSFRLSKIDALPSASSGMTPGRIVYYLAWSVAAPLFIFLLRHNTVDPVRIAKMYRNAPWEFWLVVAYVPAIFALGVLATRHRTVRIQFNDDSDHEPLFTYLLAQMHYRRPIKERDTLVYRPRFLLRAVWDFASKVSVRDEGRTVVAVGTRGVIRKLERSLRAMSAADN